jgi:signal peptidase I
MLSALVLAMWILIPGFLLEFPPIRSRSMLPTLQPGQRVLLFKAAYGLRWPGSPSWLLRWGAPGRDTIVILNSPVDGGRLVKRVRGLPGDRLSQIDGQLWINDVKIGPLSEADLPAVLPADTYLVCGDAVEKSIDSRHFGCVPGTAILGPVSPPFSLFPR